MSTQKKIIKYKDLSFGLLYDKTHIETTVKKLAQDINAYYKEILKNEQNPVVTLVCILKGAFMFFSDLSKHLDFRIQCQFIRLSSYHGDLQSSNQVKFQTKINNQAFKGKNILIIQDIVDTGKTLQELLKKLNQYQPKTIDIATMVRRPDKQQSVNVKFTGLTCSDFIIGYGLDLDQYFRCLPEIYQKI